jgi:hypothetical protein
MRKTAIIRPGGQTRADRTQLLIALDNTRDPLAGSHGQTTSMQGA